MKLNERFQKMLQRLRNGLAQVDDFEGFEECDALQFAYHVALATFVVLRKFNRIEQHIEDIFQTAVLKLLIHKETYLGLEPQARKCYVFEAFKNTAINIQNQYEKGGVTNLGKGWRLSNENMERYLEHDPTDAVSPEERKAILLMLLQRLPKKFDEPMEILKTQILSDDKLTATDLAKMFDLPANKVIGGKRALQRHAQIYHENERRFIYGPHKTAKHKNRRRRQYREDEE